MIATLVIIALIAAVGAPRFFDINVFQQQGFFDETISAVRYAQKLAVATGCTVRVQITATGFTLYRHGGTDASVCNTPPYDQAITDPSGNNAPDSSQDFKRTAPGSVTLTPSTNINFASDGSASDGSASPSVTISVGSRTFKVIFATGFVQRL